MKAVIGLYGGISCLVQQCRNCEVTFIRRLCVKHSSSHFPTMINFSHQHKTSEVDENFLLVRAGLGGRGPICTEGYAER